MNDVSSHPHPHPHPQDYNVYYFIKSVTWVVTNTNRTLERLFIHKKPPGEILIKIENDQQYLGIKICAKNRINPKFWQSHVKFVHSLC